MAGPTIGTRIANGLTRFWNWITTPFRWAWRKISGNASQTPAASRQTRSAGSSAPSQTSQTSQTRSGTLQRSQPSSTPTSSASSLAEQRRYDEFAARQRREWESNAASASSNAASSASSQPSSQPSSSSRSLFRNPFSRQSTQKAQSSSQSEPVVRFRLAGDDSDWHPDFREEYNRFKNLKKDAERLALDSHGSADTHALDRLNREHKTANIFALGHSQANKDSLDYLNCKKAADDYQQFIETEERRIRELGNPAASSASSASSASYSGSSSSSSASEPSPAVSSSGFGMPFGPTVVSPDGFRMPVQSTAAAQGIAALARLEQEEFRREHQRLKGLITEVTQLRGKLPRIPGQSMDLIRQSFDLGAASDDSHIANWEKGGEKGLEILKKTCAAYVTFIASVNLYLMEQGARKASTPMPPVSSSSVPSSSSIQPPPKQASVSPSVTAGSKPVDAEKQAAVARFTKLTEDLEAIEAIGNPLMTGKNWNLRGDEEAICERASEALTRAQLGLTINTVPTKDIAFLNARSEAMEDALAGINRDMPVSLRQKIKEQPGVPKPKR